MMKRLLENTVDGVAFFVAVPGRQVKSPSAAYLQKMGKCYPWISGIAGGLANAATTLILLPFLYLGAGHEIRSVALLTAYYLVRGIKLIDGYIDLSEGISYAAMRSKEKQDVWKVVRSPGSGSFGIVWGVILIVWQLALFKVLMNYGFGVVVGSLGLAGCLSGLALSLFHFRCNRYHPQSGFKFFGERIGELKAVLINLLISSGLAWLFLIALFPAYTALKLYALALISVLVIAFTLRLIVLKVLGAFNGDVIGFVVLICEAVILFTVTHTGLL